MTRVRVGNFSISLDGYGAGPEQSLDDPLGVGGEQLHEWFVATRTFRGVEDPDDGGRTIDDEFAARAFTGVGATIMGRNMFGPVRGPWPDDQWTGWWGPEPPYHHPVFVLTHHRRSPVEMEGGTTFHFVDDGIEAALERARDAAGGQDVLIGGGASTVRQYLGAGLIDEMHVAIGPVLLGSGERLFEGLDDLPDRYECVELTASPAAVHARIVRKA
jgi:dihydrofolate reductase